MKNETEDNKQNTIKSLLENEKKVITLTAENIGNLVLERCSAESKDKVAFRGLTYDDELFPTVLRNLPDNVSNYAELREYEIKLYEDYNRYSIQYLPYYESLADWIASAQHYGLKTRLLDWTYNPLVALFFAINNGKNENDSYILSADVKYTINEFFYFRETTDEKDEYTYKRKWQMDKNLDWIDCLTEIISYNDNPKNTARKIDFSKNIKQKGNICFLETNDANPRIIAQEGFFQLCRFPLNETHSATVTDIKLHMIEEIRNNVKCIYVIPKESKADLRKFLNEMNITTPKLFPDLGSICKFINSKTFDLSEAAWKR